MGYIPDPGARPDIDKVTENYELVVPIPEPSGGADIIAIWEENYEKIDNQMKVNADNISEIDLSKKTDTGYLQGGLLLGLTSLVSDTQYLAGDGFWYKLKSTTISPYTHDASDTPDTVYLERITHKTTLDKVENLSYSEYTSSDILVRKYNDGRMEMFGDGTTGTLDLVVTFPESFISQPKIFKNEEGLSSVYIDIVNTYSITTSDFKATGYYLTTSSSTISYNKVNINFSWCAVGYWK